MSYGEQFRMSLISKKVISACVLLNYSTIRLSNGQTLAAAGPQQIQMDPRGPVANPPAGLFLRTQANPLRSPPRSPGILVKKRNLSLLLLVNLCSLRTNVRQAVGPPQIHQNYSLPRNCSGIERDKLFERTGLHQESAVSSFKFMRI